MFLQNLHIQRHWLLGPWQPPHGFLHSSHDVATPDLPVFRVANFHALPTRTQVK
jgi:hypothetical protein